jgi:hypothetical protein
MRYKDGEIGPPRTKRQAELERRAAKRVALKFHNLTFNPWDAPDGADWYVRARAGIEARFGADADLFCDLVAATSPQVDVGVNVRLAEEALRAHRAGRPQKPYLPCHAGNIDRALKGEPLSGPKVRAFARALKGDTSAVVVDTWMLRAAGDLSVYRPSSYRIVDRAVRLVAEWESIPETEVQARVWLAHRNANWTAKKGKGDGYLPI